MVAAAAVNRIGLLLLPPLALHNSTTCSSTKGTGYVSPLLLLQLKPRCSVLVTATLQHCESTTAVTAALPLQHQCSSSSTTAAAGTAAAALLQQQQHYSYTAAALQYCSITAIAAALLLHCSSAA
eukprot:12518-Heterococcus_DN1.PRE.1